MQRLGFLKPFADKQTIDWFICYFKDLVATSSQYTCTNNFDFVLSFSVLL